MNRSKIEEEFLRALHDNPRLTLSTLSDWQLKKPLIIKGHIPNGGKLGTRALAKKYSVARRSVIRFLKNEKLKNDKDNSK